MPLNFVVGCMIDKSIVTSLEIGVPIVNDSQVYDFKLEARMGFFFQAGRTDTLAELPPRREALPVGVVLPA